MAKAKKKTKAALKKTRKPAPAKSKVRKPSTAKKSVASRQKAKSSKARPPKASRPRPSKHRVVPKPKGKRPTAAKKQASSKKQLSSRRQVSSKKQVPYKRQAAAKKPVPASKPALKPKRKLAFAEAAARQQTSQAKAKAAAPAPAPSPAKPVPPGAAKEPPPPKAKKASAKKQPPPPPPPPPRLPPPRTTKKTLERIDRTLRDTIDDWYANVGPYYVTVEKKKLDSELGDEELKRFHDAKGHRIKFAKDDLDFTYGLHGYIEDEEYLVQVSVNNKVEDFDYQSFLKQLREFYQHNHNEHPRRIVEFKDLTFSELFPFRTNFDHAFEVIQNKGKADIMRLTFLVSRYHAGTLAENPTAFRELLQDYFVSPMRRIYAALYRTKRAS